MLASRLPARLWRRLVVGFAGRMPIDSPAACMAFSAVFLLTTLFLLPGIEPQARAAPLVTQAFSGAPAAWRWLAVLRWAMTVAGSCCAWIFQARCLQLCFPDAFDPYRE
jgi:hypothetical protein